MKPTPSTELIRYHENVYFLTFIEPKGGAAQFQIESKLRKQFIYSDFKL